MNLFLDLRAWISAGAEVDYVKNLTLTQFFSRQYRSISSPKFYSFDKCKQSNFRFFLLF